MNDALTAASRLCDIMPGERARVRTLLQTGPIRRRLLDVGLTPGTLVECVGISPLGDPAAYLIRGAVIAIRGADAGDVQVEPAHGR